MTVLYTLALSGAIQVVEPEGQPRGMSTGAHLTIFFSVVVGVSYIGWNWAKLLFEIFHSKPKSGFVPSVEIPNSPIISK